MGYQDAYQSLRCTIPPRPVGSLRTLFVEHPAVLTFMAHVSPWLCSRALDMVQLLPMQLYHTVAVCEQVWEYLVAARE